MKQPWDMRNIKGKKIIGDITVELIAYDSAKSLVLKYFKFDHQGITQSKLLECRTEFTVVHNKKQVKNAKVKFVLSEIKRLGLWAFCLHRSKTNKEIHFWISKNKKIENFQIEDLISHELSHALLGVKSETTASKFGGVAALAYKIMYDELKEYIRQ
jgi:hypothetical protein